jgi:Mg2+ and Co2+ transporter CorA
MSIKNIMNKIAPLTEAVELKSEAVELALIDDMQKAMQVASKESTNAVNGLSKVTAAMDDVFTSYRQAATFSKQVLEQYDVAEGKAKELGLDLPASAKKMKDDASNIMKFSQEKMKVLQSIRGQLK